MSAALERVQRYLDAADPYVSPMFIIAGAGGEGSVPSFTLSDLREVVRMASEGVR